MNDQPVDPMEVLAVPSNPVAPRPAFAADLRTRMLRELGLGTADDIPTIDLPPRRPTTMTTPTSSPSTDATTATADVPDHQFGTVTPYLAVSGAAAALDFYREAFGAVEHFRVEGDDGRIGHADFTIGPARFYLSDEYPEVGVTSPTTAGATTVALHLEVDDVDAVYARAVAVGATALNEPADQAHGARHGTLVDPFGHRWMLSQQLESVDLDEYNARLREEGAWTATSPDTGAGTPGSAVQATPAHGGIWTAIAAADAPALISFLVDVIGFERQIVVEDGGAVVHSQLRWPEGGVVQVATVARPDSVYSDRPVGVASTYVITTDPEAVYRRCVAAGVEIVDTPRATEYDPEGLVFGMRDAEGNLWSFGTYAGEG